jgi:hypothetical protein
MRRLLNGNTDAKQEGSLVWENARKGEHISQQGSTKSAHSSSSDSAGSSEAGTRARIFMNRDQGGVTLMHRSEVRQQHGITYASDVSSLQRAPITIVPCTRLVLCKDKLRFRVDVDLHGGVNGRRMGEWSTAYFAIDAGQLLKFGIDENGEVSTMPKRCAVS